MAKDKSGSGLKCPVDTLAASAVPVDMGLYHPRSMDVCGNNLVMPVYRTQKSFIIVPLPLNGSSFQAGPSGRGPMDFLNVDYSSLKTCGDKFVVADASGMKTCHIDKERIVVESNDAIIAGNRNNGISTLKNGYIDMAPQSSGHEFVIYGKSGSVEKYISKMPDFSKDKKSEPLFLYLKRWTVNVDKGLVAAFYCHFDRMKILDLKGRTIKEVKTDMGFGKKVDDDMTRLCYTCISSVTKEYIPVLHKNDGSSEIQVWDWNGNLVKRFIIRSGVSIFSMDWKNGKVYYIDNTVDDIIFEADFRM